MTDSSTRNIELEASLATIARFLRIGLELGVCAPETARAWAISVIDRMDDPPGEIIEASYRKPLPQLIEDLNDVRGDVDLPAVRGWLVHELWKSFCNPVESLDGIVRKGMQLASSVHDDDLYWQFDWIDDSLQLAVSGTYGTVEDCRVQLEQLMKRCMVPAPFEDPAGVPYSGPPSHGA